MDPVACWKRNDSTNPSDCVPRARHVPAGRAGVPWRRIRALPSLAPVLLLTGLLAACDHVRVLKEELWVRHEEEEDQIELLCLYDGIFATEDVNAALSLVDELLGGRRIGTSWLLSVNLDDEDLGEEDREVMAEIRPVSARAFRNDEGQLSIFQEFRIAHASRVVRRLNAYLLDNIREQAASERNGERARALREFLAEGLMPLTFRGSQLLVRLPGDDAEIAELRAALEAAAMDPSHPLADVISFSIEGERAELLLGKEGAKAFVLRDHDEAAEHDRALLEPVVESGRDVRFDLRFEEVLARFLED